MVIVAFIRLFVFMLLPFYIFCVNRNIDEAKAIQTGRKMPLVAVTAARGIIILFINQNLGINVTLNAIGS